MISALYKKIREGFPVKKESEFSKFIRSASSREKKKVFVKVAREAAEEQRKVIEGVEFAR